MAAHDVYLRDGTRVSLDRVGDARIGWSSGYRETAVFRDAKGKRVVAGQAGGVWLEISDVDTLPVKLAVRPRTETKSGILQDQIRDSARVVADIHGDIFRAYIGGQMVGALVVDRYDKALGDDRRHVSKSAVGIFNEDKVITPVLGRQDIRRHGIGTLMYDAAEAALARDGLVLVPSSSSCLSYGAWEFWRRRNPALLEDDPRKYWPQYIGKTIPHNGSEWRIRHVSPGTRGFYIEALDGSFHTAQVRGAVVHAVHGEPDEAAANTYLHAVARRPTNPPAVAITLPDMDRAGAVPTPIITAEPT